MGIALVRAEMVAPAGATALYGSLHRAHRFPSSLGIKKVKAQLAASPLCDSGSARDAGSRSANSVSSMRLSVAVAAACCHPARS